MNDIVKPVFKKIGEIVLGKFIDNFKMETELGTVCASAYIPLTKEKHKVNRLMLFGMNTSSTEKRSTNGDFSVRYGYYRDQKTAFKIARPFKSRPFIRVSVTDTDVIPIIINENEEGFEIEFLGAESGVTPEFTMSVKGTRRPIFLREHIYMNVVKVSFVAALPILFQFIQEGMQGRTGFGYSILCFGLWVYYRAKEYIERLF